MAISKFEKTNTEKQELDLTENGKNIKALYEKIDESIGKTNEHITKVASMQTEINTEKNKIGITSEQAAAIVANTAKVGITDEQIKNIKDNTAKTGITTSQANAITLNSKKIGLQLLSELKNDNIADMQFILVGGKNLGEFSIRLQFVIESRIGKAQIHFIDLPLQRGK